MADSSNSRPRLTKEDVKAELDARNNFLRESWIKAMEAKLVREELEKCNRGEGVNSYENCKYLADLYLSKLKDAKVKGYRTVDV